MFKLIGIVVVVAVFVLGFDAIRKWYVGDATPQETVSEIRKVVGEKIGGKGLLTIIRASPETVLRVVRSQPLPQNRGWIRTRCSVN